MRLISSRRTIFAKRIAPVLVLGVGATCVLMFLGTVAIGSHGMRPRDLAMVAASFALTIWCYLFHVALVRDVVDEVWDAGMELVVWTKGAEHHLSLSGISSISYTRVTAPRRVTLSLRQPSSLGETIVFIPQTAWTYLVIPSTPVVDDLIRRVDAMNRGRHGDTMV